MAQQPAKLGWTVSGELPKGRKWCADADTWDDAVDWANTFQQGEFYNVRIVRKDDSTEEA